MLASSALAWVITLCSTIPLVILDEDVYLTVNNVTLFASTAIIIFCQVIVRSFEARRHKRQITAHQVSGETRKNFLKEKRAFKLTTIVLLTLLVTYVPIFSVRILLTKSGIIRSENVAFIAFYASIFVLVLNSLILKTRTITNATEA